MKKLLSFLLALSASLIASATQLPLIKQNGSFSVVSTHAVTPSVSISVQLGGITVSAITLGQTPSIVWNAVNATSCTASSSPSTTFTGSVATSSAGTAVTPSPTGTYVFTLSCSGPGGTGTSNTSLQVNATSGGQTFPSLGWYAIQNNHDYDTTGVLQRMAVNDVVVINLWNGWRDPNTGATGLKTLQDLAAITTRSTMTFGYFIPTESGPYAGYGGPCPVANGSGYGFPAPLAQINAMNAWARTTYPSGSVVVAGYNDCFLNYTSGGNTGVGGRTWVQYAADYAADFYVNGDAAGLATDGTDPVNHLWTGFYQDGLYGNFPATADWDRTGSPNSGSPPESLLGQIYMTQRLQADTAPVLPGGVSLACGNVAILTGTYYSQYYSYYGGKYDCGELENMYGGGGNYNYQGQVNSVEATQNTAGYVLAYQQLMGLLSSKQIGIWSAYNISANGEDAMDLSHPYQAMRAGLASCMVLGNARCDLQDTSQTLDGSAALWFDEYAVNTTTHLPCTYTTNIATACGAYIGYLGTATDPPQTAAYQGCTWRRRFQYGEVWWNPKDCAATTLNFGYTVHFINGYQAPSVNKGGTGATAPISARDGLIVLYE